MEQHNLYFPYTNTDKNFRENFVYNFILIENVFKFIRNFFCNIFICVRKPVLQVLMGNEFHVSTGMHVYLGYEIENFLSLFYFFHRICRQISNQKTSEIKPLRTQKITFREGSRSFAVTTPNFLSKTSVSVRPLVEYIVIHVA